MNETQKVIIIGGGFAGLAAGIYASRSMLSPILFEGEPGGQLMLTSDVENYPGFEDPILGPDLMSRVKKQALRFGTNIISKKIKSVRKVDELIEVIDQDDSKYLTKSLLLATGAQAKWLELPSEVRLRGKGVSACATCDGFFFRDKHVVVVGGGDSAMEEATYLTKFASKVTLIHRRNEFRASIFMQEKAKNNSKIEIILNTEIKEILGDEKVEAVKVISEGKVYDIKCDGVFVAIGHEPSTKFLIDSGVLLDEKGYILTTERVRFDNIEEYREIFNTNFRKQTSISGIFAAGDCVDYRYRQAATASGDAVASILEIEQYLH